MIEHAIGLYNNLNEREPVPELMDRIKDIPEGLVLEFGVAEGKSIKSIQEITGRTVYGFDSFEGLPEDWGPGMPKGKFKCEVPDLGSNIKLIVGLFQDTLDGFLLKHPEDIALVHLDCDLYSSHAFVLSRLKSRFIPGSIIILDDVACYPDTFEHGFKAFYEFLESFGQTWTIMGKHTRDGAMFRL